MNSIPDKQIKFPSLSQELIDLYQLDQNEIKDNFNRIAGIRSKKQRNSEFEKIKIHSLERAKRMLEILEKITLGSGEPSDIEKLEILETAVPFFKFLDGFFETV